jgi:hypothetical protein
MRNVEVGKSGGNRIPTKETQEAWIGGGDEVGVLAVVT